MTPSRWPVRARLTAMYASVFLAAGAALVAVTYWLVSRSLSQHVDATRSHVGADAALTGIVRDEIAAYRARTLDDLLIWSLLALVATLAIAVVAGWVLAGRALRPLRHITDTATRIADRNLHERIALTGPHDEVKELADTIDDMLERLDRSFDAQRRFVANASHELRTPLAVNRTLLEVAAADPDASKDLKRIAPRLLATNERSERLVNGLLTLARSEQPIEERTPIDLATVAAAAIDYQRQEAQRARRHYHNRPAPGTDRRQPAARRATRRQPDPERRTSRLIRPQRRCPHLAPRHSKRPGSREPGNPHDCPGGRQAVRALPARKRTDLLRRSRAWPVDRAVDRPRPWRHDLSTIPRRRRPHRPSGTTRPRPAS